MSVLSLLGMMTSCCCRSSPQYGWGAQDVSDGCRRWLERGRRFVLFCEFPAFFGGRALPKDLLKHVFF